MKFFFYILVIPFFLVQKSMAQQPNVSKIKVLTYHHQVTAGPVFPIATFSETHYPGITASYIRKMNRLRPEEPFTRKKTSWLTAASFTYFMGKKENAGNSTFRYKGYSLLDVHAGLAWYPKPKINFSLLAGPGLGYYNKLIRFTVTGRLHGSYSISPKTNITPGLSFIKEAGSDALWITSLQLGFVF